MVLESSADGHPATLRPPHQARSRDTLERLAAAASALLQTRSFDDLSVVEIVKAAGSSVGSFYARFPDKDALLDYLDERYTVAVLALQDDLLAHCRGEGSLAEKVGHVVRGLVALHRGAPGLLRTLVLRARRQRDPRYAERTARMNARLPLLGEALLRHRAEITHPSPERAVALGFSFAFAAVRERILFPEALQDGERITDETLADELTRAWLAYLGCDTGSLSNGS